MPTHLTRYILIEIIKIFVVALFVLTMLILLIGVGRKLLSEGLGPLAVVQLLPFLIPVSLQFSFPATALFAVCCVYGRMSADGEISTIKASGISPLRVLQPALIFAALLSPIAVYLSDVSVSWGRSGVNRVVLMSIEDVVYRVLRAQHSYTSEHGFSIHVREVKGRQLIHPTVTVHNKGDRGQTKLSAREGRLTLDADSQSLLLRSRRQPSRRWWETARVHAGRNSTSRSRWAAQMKEKHVSQRSPSELPLRLIGDERIRQDSTHSSSRRADGGTHRVCRVDITAGTDCRSAGPDDVRTAAAEQETIDPIAYRAMAALGRRLQLFVLCPGGCPLAIIAKTSDYWTTFGLCFLPTLVLYFPLFLLGLEQAKDGNIPPYGVWLSNVVLGSIGIVLIARVRRY